MVDRRHVTTDEMTDVAVVEAATVTPSATQQYLTIQEEVDQAEQRLSALEQHTRKTQTQTLEILTLQNNIAHMRHEKDALWKAVEHEQLCMRVEDVVAVWNAWTVPQRDAFEALAESMLTLGQNARAFVEVHDAEHREIVSVPGSADVPITVPTGQEALTRLYGADIQDGAAWLTVLRSLFTGVFGPKQIAQMRRNHTTAQAQDERHTMQTIRRQGRG